jgi:hypothetical protein
MHKANLSRAIPAGFIPTIVMTMMDLHGSGDGHAKDGHCRDARFCAV